MAKNIAGKALLWYSVKQLQNRSRHNMKLYFKQRLFSWFDSYDIYDEEGNTVYTVKGEFSLGHKLPVYTPNGEYLGRIQERILTLLPKFEIYIHGRYMGEIKKEFSFFTPRFTLDCRDWEIEGDIFGWDYTVTSRSHGHIMSVSKELFRLTDTYVLDIADPENALLCLMIVLAIDAEACSND